MKYLCVVLLAGLATVAGCGSGTGTFSSSTVGGGGGTGGTGGTTGSGTGGTGGTGGTTGGGTGGGTGSIQSVNHIVIMMQENRSFDHYFGHLGAYRAANGGGAATDIDGTPANVSLKTWDGSPNVSPFHMVSACSYDMTSNWQETHNTINLTNPTQVTGTPPMNGAASMQGGFCVHDAANKGTTCPDPAGARAMGYYTERELPFYYWAATQFGTSNRWFSPAPARTQPNRMYLLAATSQGYTLPPTSSLTAKTIFQLLQENNISWRVYVTDNWAPGKTGDTYMTYFPSFTNQHIANFAPATQFATDAANGTLPQVSLIETGYESSATDEHPQDNIQKGAAYVAKLVNALIGSPSWKDSVFFATYDEFGGLYDHVPPMQTVNPDGIPPKDLGPNDPKGDFTITGLRVPLIVISPFTKLHFVSNTPADFTAMLKFIETRFNLPSLNKRDAAQPDMTEFFDWSAPNMSPGTAPAQPVNAPCYQDHLP
ncbi:MAG TPA: alkaline phosphatase family protein [Candidatus Saccharimonadales bacterium]|nr:alkaline phosphatase family protein [Candidatus Saccharimonadales bacterium]